MSSTFGTLEIARSGLNAAQVGMSVTSQNTSNADTTGYTRQAVDSSSVSADTGSYRYSSTSANIGQGVNSSTIYQIRDTFLDVRYRYANSDYNLASSTESQMAPIEDQFNEVSDTTSTTNKLTGLTGDVTNLLTSLSSAETDYSSSTVSSDIEAKADYIASSIRTDAAFLKTSLASENSELNVYVTGGSGDTSNGNNTGGINGIIENIQSLNKEISSYELTGQTANDLRDARNNALDKLSSYIDIDTKEQSNGMVTVNLKNDDDGKSIIDANNTANEFVIGTNNVVTTTTGTLGSTTTMTAAYTVLEWGVSKASNGTVTDAATEETNNAATDTKDSLGNYTSSNAAANSKSTQSISSKNIANVQGGIVKAYLNVINGDGSSTSDVNTGKCGDVGIPYIQKKLNEFAVGFMNIMNNASSTVIDSSKTNGSQFITYMQKDSSGNDTTLYSTTGGGTPVLATDADVASTIQVTSAWSKDKSLFGDNYTDTSTKNAYYTDYYNALYSTANTVTVGSADGSSQTYKGSLSNFATTFTSDISTAVSNASNSASSTGTTKTNLDSQRQSISSVSTNDEAVNLIKYQQAYSANGRMITAIDEMLDKLINSTGRVGL